MKHLIKEKIDWEKFDSLSESERIREIKTWDDEQCEQYFMRNGIMSEEEVFNYLIKKVTEGCDNGSCV